MLKGYNSDLRVGATLFHVQTEDWGRDNPYIVTRVFKQGAVIKSIKTPYQSILPKGHYEENLIREAMKQQHYSILDQISVSGLP
jgi:hypothetical protein